MIFTLNEYKNVLYTLTFFMKSLVKNKKQHLFSFNRNILPKNVKSLNKKLLIKKIKLCIFKSYTQVYSHLKKDDFEQNSL